MILSLLNNIAVSFLGGILSASFCGAFDTRRKRFFLMTGIAFLCLFQGMIYFFRDPDFIRRIYPLIVHLPLLFLLYFLTGKLLWPFFSILSAYLCCQLRRWIALFVTALLSGGMTTQYIAELLLTLPLLILLLHFASPVVRRLSDYSVRLQCQFGFIPALYYVFDYLTNVYTRLLTGGDPVVVEFMPFVYCAAYLIFLLYHSGREHTQNQLKQAQKSLGIQLNQAVREISALRESQSMATRYRHDMRHHLQYVSVCIENNQKEKALSYIDEICREMEQQKVRRYCENETANLILSAFAGRAKKDGISLHISGTLPAVIRLSDSDLCVLLSNALENAIYASLPFASAGEICIIDVRFYLKADRLFLQMENPCHGEMVSFENGIPISHEIGHGIGVQSICAIVEKYGGIYSFQVQNNRFILRLSL